LASDVNVYHRGQYERYPIFREHPECYIIGAGVSMIGAGVDAIGASVTGVAVTGAGLGAAVRAGDKKPDC
jgi:hypothetical protein